MEEVNNAEADNNYTSTYRLHSTCCLKDDFPYVISFDPLEGKLLYPFYRTGN